MEIEHHMWWSLKLHVEVHTECAAHSCECLSFWFMLPACKLPIPVFAVFTLTRQTLTELRTFNNRLSLLKWACNVCKSMAPVDHNENQHSQLQRCRTLDPYHKPSPAAQRTASQHFLQSKGGGGGPRPGLGWRGRHGRGLGS